MELEKGGDGDHSTEMLSTLKRFEDVCNSLEDEHAKLLDLEKRRKKLNQDLERLRSEIREEKDFLRSAIDESVVEESPNANEHSNDPLNGLMEPMNLDMSSIKEFIKTQREEITAHKQMCSEHMNEGPRRYEDSTRKRQAPEKPECAGTTSSRVSEEHHTDDENVHDDIEILNTSEAQPEDFLDYITSEEE